VLATLTIIKYDFLLSLGWHPINDPTSAERAGARSLRMDHDRTFITSGLIMTLSPAASFWSETDLPPAFAVYFATLAFTTDPTIRTPRHLHGRLHDLSFVLLGTTLPYSASPSAPTSAGRFRLTPGARSRWQDQPSSSRPRSTSSCFSSLWNELGDTVR
jgi:hypothetical protein